MDLFNNTIPDVTVIGAGPAGLCAAIRSRWIKSHGGVCCSTLILEGSGNPGGLARMGSTKLTGPSFDFNSKTFLAPLLKDIEQFNIPILFESVEKVEQQQNLFKLHLRSGKSIKTRSIIIATGLRELSNEADFFLNGLIIPYNGYDYIETIVQQAMKKTSPECVVVVGNKHTANIAPLLVKAFAKVPEKLFVDICATTENTAVMQGFKHLHCNAVEFEGKDALNAVLLKKDNGDTTQIETQLVFVDYTAFETQPNISINIDGLKKTPEGFIDTDKKGATSIPGIFAAGDITGVYAMAVKAASEGAVSGFGAYEYVFRQKFGTSPALYAYASDGRKICQGESDFPEFKPTHKLIPLAIKKQWETVFADITENKIEPIFPLELGKIQQVFGKQTPQVVRQLLASKDFTLTL